MYEPTEGGPEGEKTDGGFVSAIADLIKHITGKTYDWIAAVKETLENINIGIKNRLHLVKDALVKFFKHWWETYQKAR